LNDNRKNLRRRRVIDQLKRQLSKAEKGHYPSKLSNQLGETEKVQEWKADLGRQIAILQGKIDGGKKVS